MSEQYHILVVDDDARLRALLQRYLSENGFMVTAASSAAEAREKLALIAFDLMVLDIMMPGETGLELAESLSGETKTPILFLTALAEPENRIEGLEKGADDYLPKPFEPRELVLRLQAILRRAQEKIPAKRELAFGPFVFDLATSKLSQSGEPVYLTSSELALLKILAESAGVPVSRETLAQLTLDASSSGSERSADVQINRLRKKIEPIPARPIYIQTVRGAGYVLHGD